MNATADAERQGVVSRSEGSEENPENPPPPLAGGGWGEGAPPVHQSILSHARAMRRDPTRAERKLWQALRKRQAGGLKYRRQVPLGPYIADFYCSSAQLVVEVDGISHLDSSSDAIRDEWMKRHGLRIFRVTNSDVFSNLEGIVMAIEQVACAPPLPAPLPQGEGESPYARPTSTHV